MGIQLALGDSAFVLVSVISAYEDGIILGHFPIGALGFGDVVAALYDWTSHVAFLSLGFQRDIFFAYFRTTRFFQDGDRSRFREDFSAFRGFDWFTLIVGTLLLRSRIIVDLLHHFAAIFVAVFLPLSFFLA